MFGLSLLPLVLAFGGYIMNKIDSYNESQNQLDLAESNLQLNKDVSEKNFNLQEQQLEYQKELNQTLMDREDTAIQRQVADLKAVGLSPLMVSGGASAQPLNAGTAPQRDLSGINQALSNVVGAYNDFYNRKLAYKNFSLQNRVQSAQMYTNLLESKYQQSYLREQIDYLRDKHEYENIHGFRDLNWKSELVSLIEKLAGVNPSSSIPSSPGEIKDSVSQVVDNVVEGVVDSMNQGKNSSDNDYVSNYQAYAIRHPFKTIASYQDRVALIKNPGDMKNRKDLYGRLKILQDNFTLEDWLKLPNDVVRDFCKGKDGKAYVIPDYYYKRLKIKKQYNLD